jgi:YHS domain-containing protein
MTFSKRLLAFSLVSAILAIPVLAAAGGEKVKRVDAKYVCFITRKHFDQPQTAVVVDGKKYYGCCEDCSKQLREDPKSRVAVDPVSGKELDKGVAVVGMDKAGNVYFFENETNLKKFRVPAGS